METLEIQAKSFVTKWVTATDDSYLSWQIQASKRLVNVTIYRKRDVDADADVNAMFPPRPPATKNRSGSVISTTQSELSLTARKRSSSLTAGLNNCNLIMVKNYNRLNPEELTKGSIQVEKAGTFAFVFDNSFSKTHAKKVLFSHRVLDREDATEVPALRRGTTIMRPKNGQLIQGVLSKRRRKKHQGFVKRFFILSFKYGTLSYYQLNNRNHLRGNMPIKHCIISANAQAREIVIDSGLEIWDLKASTAEEWSTWVAAFNTVKENTLPHYHRTPVTFETETVAPATRLLQQQVLSIQTQVAGLVKLAKQPDADERRRFWLRKKGSEDRLAVTSLQDLQKSVEELAAGIERLAQERRRSVSLLRAGSVVSQDFYDAEDYLETTQLGVVVLDEPLETSRQEGQTLMAVLPLYADSSTDTESEEDAPFPRTAAAQLLRDLYPLPVETPRRTDLAENTVQPPSIIAFVRKNVGKDLSAIAMPVSMNEPLTFLQKYAEIFEYADMIDAALAADGPSGERLLRIAAFAVSYQSSARAYERNKRKPFNPLLGETFEYVHSGLGFRMVAEKVSHRPPIMALAADSAAWLLRYTTMPTSKFWGKSAEFTMGGVLRLTVTATGEVFEWTQPTTLLKNIIAGVKYTEPSSGITVSSSLGQRAVVTFKESGMFLGRSEELSISCYDQGGRQLPALVVGKWTTAMTLRLPGSEKVIWTAGPLLPMNEKKFGFTEFAASLNEISEVDRAAAPTDSRMRPDQRFYENGQADKAETMKAKLEENQRVRRKQMEDAHTHHEPKFFKQASAEGEMPVWDYATGEKGYWERRKTGDWNDLVKLW